MSQGPKRSRREGVLHPMHRMLPLRAGFLAIALTAVTPAVYAADQPAAAATTDQKTVLRARAFFDAGRLVEAEKLYREILAAVDAGSLPTAELGHSLGPLTQIYRTWGRNDDALKMAQRSRKF